VQAVTGSHDRIVDSERTSPPTSERRRLIAPRPYQTAVIDAARASIQAGRRRPLIVAPTGAGKSTIAALICSGALARGRRVAWFAHRTELRDQAIATLAACGVVAGHSGANASLPVQVVSTQGAASRGQVPEADLVILDEAHHYAEGNDWTRVVQAYPSDTIVIGLTATPERTDGRGLGHLHDDLLVAAQPSALVDAGYLVPCEILRPSKLQRGGAIAQRPVDAYLSATPGRRNVVFAPSIAEAERFGAQFTERQVRWRMVHGKLSDDVRRDALRSFRSGECRVLINVFVLTEGWDCPETDVITVARRMGSASMWLQSCGRGLRPAQGKEKLTILDLVGASHVHGSPLEDRDYSLDGAGIARKGQAGSSFCRVCGSLLVAGEACETCATPWNEAKPLEVTKDPLERFAHIRRDNDEERARRLSRWIGEARSKGHKWQSALYRYQGAYGAAPTGAIVTAAMGYGQSARR
jgi:DNA repair protein RadD